jgi:hypothetical protein
MAGWLAGGNTDNRANSAKFQLKLPTGAKLGNKGSSSIGNSLAILQDKSFLWWQHFIFSGCLHIRPVVAEIEVIVHWRSFSFATFIHFDLATIGRLSLEVVFQ